jgi:hypothetical protein
MRLKRSEIVSGILLLSFVLLGTGCLFFCIFSSPHPAKDQKYIRDFETHRAEFERLRIMLQQDTQLIVVADWGARTRNGAWLSGSHYDEYMRLLKQVGGGPADRAEGEPADPSITLWGWGWAGNTRHLGICWLDQAPTNLIPTLDNYYHRRAYGHPIIAYRHVETNWYLWTDL